MIKTQEMINFPVFAENGKKLQPNTAKYSAGFQEADVLPAEWVNYFENKSSSAITTLNAGLLSIEKELNNLITSIGGSPNESQNTQILDSIKIIAQGLNSASSTKLQTPRVFTITDADGTNAGTPSSFDGTEDKTLNLPANIKANIEGDLNGSASKFGGYSVAEFLNLVSSSLPINVTSNIEINNPINTKYIVTNDNVVITLKNGSFAGQKININFIKKGSISQIIEGSVISETSSVGQNCEFMWNGSSWEYVDNHSAGDIKSTTSSTAPIGWLLCNGQEISKTTYQRLYEVIGDKYGTASDTSDFILPDYRECVLVGTGQNQSLTIANHDVYEIGEFKDDQLQGHWHRVFDNGYTPGGGDSSGWTCGYQGSKKDATTIKSDGINGSPRIGSTTHSKQIGVNFLIRY